MSRLSGSRSASAAAISSSALAESARRGRRRLAAMIAGLGLSVPLIGFPAFVLRSHEDVRAALDELRVLVDSKTDQTEHWIAERRGDAETLAESGTFIRQVQAVQLGGGRVELDQIWERLTVLRRAFTYDSIVLLDRAGRTLVTIGESVGDVRPGLLLAEVATATGATKMSAPFRHPAGRMHVTFAVPLIGKDGSGPVGAVLLQIDLDNFLYPLLRSWPTGSASGEGLLASRDGQSVLVLNDLRDRPGTGLALRLGLDQTRHPAVAGVAAVGAGTIEGFDDRGLPVLAAWRKVRGTDWTLVAKVDRQEALAAAMTTSAWAGGITSLGVVMVGGALLLVHRQRRAQELALHLKTDQLLTQFYDLPFLGMAIVSPETRLWVRFNNRLCEMFGYSREEMAARTWVDLTYPEDLDGSVLRFEQFLGGDSDGYTLEKRGVHKDGRVFPVLLDVKCVRTAGSAVDYVVMTVEDISARKVIEEKIRRLNRLYRTLSRSKEAIVRCQNDGELFAEACRAAVESGGLSMAWVGLLDPETRTVHPVATAGAGVEYLKEIRISSDGNDPAGQGPTGTAVREGEPVWCQDFATDSRTVPWQAIGRRFGWGASAALPLRRRNQVVGSFTVYSGSANVFDDETRSLLVELSLDISLGLDRYDSEASRRRVTDQLHESEERYRLLIDNSQDAILLITDGEILAANPAACRTFGSSETALRMTGRSGVLDQADPRVAEALDASARTGQFSGALTMQRRDGEAFPADVTMTAFMLRSGEHRTSMIIRDRTEHQRGEEALRRRVRQQQLVAGLGGFALASTDLSAVFARAAAAASEGVDVAFSQVLQVGAAATFVLVAGTGWEPGWIGRRIHGSDKRSQPARVIASKAPVVIDDFANESRFSPSEILSAHAIVSGVDVLIGGARHPFGVLGAYTRDRRVFGPEDIDFLQGIANALATAVDRQGAEDQLAYNAQHDALTGLPNRLLLTDRLTVALAHAQRSDTHLALMFLDLDRFKNVNDTLGHAAGDRLLREVATRLTACLRASDTVSRQGGDEFLVVVPDVSTDEDAARLAQKLITAIAQPFTLGSNKVALTVSVGIACFPGNGQDAETLLHNADAAMYFAKASGRDRYQFNSVEMNVRAQERLDLEADLRHAIDRGQLSLAYQPQIDFGSGAVVGIEALARWQHPERGMVSPPEFIRIAEESGQIVAIGTWVLETACRQHAHWVSEGLVNGTVAVNVSAHQFHQPGFVDTIAAVLSRTGLPARLLELELTETVVMQAVDQVLLTLQAVKTLGVRLAIDDFGTGYSSLSYLKQFPISRLKIDRSFTRGLPDDRESAAITQAVISMGHSLGLNVLAEGVETVAQDDHLRALWCDAGQGYLYTPPMAADACTKYLVRQTTTLAVTS